MSGNIENKELRNRITEELNLSLKKFIDKESKSTELFFKTGIVVDNNDPDKLGRCKIRVYGVFEDEIPDIDLPWAIPDFNFIGSNLGSFVVPPLNTLVKVYFESNDIYLPRYTTKVINKDLLTSTSFIANKDEDYPNSMIFFETDAGEYFKINKATNTTTYRHASGLFITIDVDGNIEIDNTDISVSNNPDNSSDSSTIGNITINCKSNFNINVGGDMNITCDGKFKVQSIDNTIKAENPINPLGAKNRLVSTGSENFVPVTLTNDPYSTAPLGKELGIPPIYTLTGLENG